jgi:hypothetical protein
MNQRMGADNEIRKEPLRLASLGLATARCVSGKSPTRLFPHLRLKFEINFNRSAIQEPFQELAGCIWIREQFRINGRGNHQPALGAGASEFRRYSLVWRLL